MNGHFDQTGTERARIFSHGETDIVLPQKTTGVISITSGKGGVGKTAVAANIGVSLARAGEKVLLVDADLGLANIDVLFGLTPKCNLNHFFAGERALEEVVVEGPAGIRILPAGSGVQSVTSLSTDQKLRFMEAIEAFHGQFDLVIIDAGTGISENVTFFNVSAQEIVLVATPEPASIANSHAMMELLSAQYHEKRFNLVVNLARNEKEALEVYRNLSLAANRSIDISIGYLGFIPFDRRMHDAISRQRTMVELFPHCRASAGFAAVAQNLIEVSKNARPKGTMQFFWRHLLACG